MTIASQLPKSTLDIRGDRLRYLLANAINECEAQYRRGQADKTTNTIALLNAAIAKLNGMSLVGSITIGAIAGDNIITSGEAAAPVNVAVTTVNFANGATLSVRLDGASTPTTGITVTTVSANAATVTFTSAAATALTVATHTLTVSGVDSAGITRTRIVTFNRA